MSDVHLHILFLRSSGNNNLYDGAIFIPQFLQTHPTIKLTSLSRNNYNEFTLYLKILNKEKVWRFNKKSNT